MGCTIKMLINPQHVLLKVMLKQEKWANWAWLDGGDSTIIQPEIFHYMYKYLYTLKYM